jgi:hypothetical protein
MKEVVMSSKRWVNIGDYSQIASSQDQPAIIPARRLE